MVFASYLAFIELLLLCCLLHSLEYDKFLLKNMKNGLILLGQKLSYFMTPYNNKIPKVVQGKPFISCVLVCKAINCVVLSFHLHLSGFITHFQDFFEMSFHIHLVHTLSPGFLCLLLRMPRNEV